MDQYGFASKVTVGRGQYRNAVASGRRCAPITEESCIHKIDPTLPRYGTDLFQAPILTFEAIPSSRKRQRVAANARNTFKVRQPTMCRLII